MSAVMRRGRLSSIAAVAMIALAASVSAAAASPSPNAATVSPGTASSLVGKYRITIHLKKAMHVHVHGGRTRRQVFEIGKRCAGGRCELAWLFNGHAVGLIHTSAGGGYRVIIRERGRCLGSGKRTVNAFHVRFTARSGAIRGTESLVNSSCGVRSSELVAFRGHRL